MPEFDKDTLDYFKSNLEREVRENVEKRLFKSWLALAAAFLTGVGFIGAPWLISYLDGKVSTAVETQVTNRVAEPTARAKQVAEDAQLLAQTARDKISTALAEVELRRKLVDEALLDMRTKSSVAGEQVDKLRSAFEVRAKEIDTALKSARDRVSEIDDKATQLSDRLRNAVPDAGVLASLAVDVKSLVGEVGQLGTELKRVAEKAGAPPVAEATREQQAQIAKLEETATQRTQQVQQQAPGVTVYVQFAGLNREHIKNLSAQLAQGGFKVPGEERLAAAANLREIRCFYPPDCQQAKKVKELVDGYLADLYNDSTRTVTIKELYSFTPKPRQGIIEIWLGLGNPA